MAILGLDAAREIWKRERIREGYDFAIEKAKSDDLDQNVIDKDIKFHRLSLTYRHTEV